MAMLNVTHLEHTLIALGIQAVILVVAWILQWLSVPVVILSAVAPSMLLFGREHAQAEDRIRSSKKEKYPSWETTLAAMKFWKWDFDSFMDFFAPVLANVLTAIVLWCFI